ncbi:MAG: hypothetical protein ABUK01_19295, partial [Leptospirales bacterium]
KTKPTKYAFDKLINELIKKYEHNDVTEFIETVRMAAPISIDSEVFRFFTLHALIKFRTSNKNRNFYDMTEKGNLVADGYLEKSLT